MLLLFKLVNRLRSYLFNFEQGVVLNVVYKFVRGVNLVSQLVLVLDLLVSSLDSIHLKILFKCCQLTPQSIKICSQSCINLLNVSNLLPVSIGGVLKTFKTNINVVVDFVLLCLKILKPSGLVVINISDLLLELCIKFLLTDIFYQNTINFISVFIKYFLDSRVLAHLFE